MVRPHVLMICLSGILAAPEPNRRALQGGIPDGARPILSAGQCRQKLDIQRGGYFYVSNFPTKGCFRKNGSDNVYFGTGGTVEEMSTVELSGTQQRVWGDVETDAPTAMPTPQPSPQPSPQPTSAEPTKSPSAGPTASPSPAPTTAEPTNSPSASPTSSPSQAPTTTEPTTSPSASPTSPPSPAPTTAEPTKSPSASPTPSPSQAPTTAEPTPSPSASPTSPPSPAPITAVPTRLPSASPTHPPTQAPTTATPTRSPSASPTLPPTPVQTTAAPTKPTPLPSSQPTSQPTLITQSPTAQSTGAPTQEMVSNQSVSWLNFTATALPTKSPVTSAPTEEPTPSREPTMSPSSAPTTAAPSTSPSESPTTAAPSTSPTASPTSPPSAAPTTAEPTPSPSSTPITGSPTTDSPTTGQPIATPSPTTKPSTTPVTSSPTGTNAIAALDQGSGNSSKEKCEERRRLKPDDDKKKGGVKKKTQPGENREEVHANEVDDECQEYAETQGASEQEISAGSASGEPVDPASETPSATPTQGPSAIEVIDSPVSPTPSPSASPTTTSPVQVPSSPPSQLVTTLSPLQPTATSPSEPSTTMAPFINPETGMVDETSSVATSSSTPPSSVSAVTDPELPASDYADEIVEENGSAAHETTPSLETSPNEEDPTSPDIIATDEVVQEEEDTDRSTPWYPVPLSPFTLTLHTDLATNSLDSNELSFLVSDHLLREMEAGMTSADVTRVSVTVSPMSYLRGRQRQLSSAESETKDFHFVVSGNAYFAGAVIPTTETLDDVSQESFEDESGSEFLRSLQNAEDAGLRSTKAISTDMTRIEEGQIVDNYLGATTNEDDPLFGGKFYIMSLVFGIGFLLVALYIFKTRRVKSLRENNDDFIDEDDDASRAPELPRYVQVENENGSSTKVDTATKVDTSGDQQCSMYGSFRGALSRQYSQDGGMTSTVSALTQPTFEGGGILSTLRSYGITPRESQSKKRGSDSTASSRSRDLQASNHDQSKKSDNLSVFKDLPSISEASANVQEESTWGLCGDHAAGSTKRKPSAMWGEKPSSVSNTGTVTNAEDRSSACENENREDGAMVCGCGDDVDDISRTRLTRSAWSAKHPEEADEMTSRISNTSADQTQFDRGSLSISRF